MKPFHEHLATSVHDIHQSVKYLRQMATRLKYVSGHESPMVADLDAQAYKLEYLADRLLNQYDADQKQQLSDAKATVSGVLHELLQK